MTRLTRDEYLARLAASRSKKANKYNAVKSGGYDSRRENRRACELKMMQRAGQISELREQVRYQLIPPQRDADGRVVERACSYIADFVYFDESTKALVVEDTKGVRTDVYRIKRKLMLFVHGITIQEK